MLSEDIVGSSDCEEVTDEVCGAEVDCDEVEEVGKRAFCGEGVEGDFGVLPLAREMDPAFPWLARGLFAEDREPDGACLVGVIGDRGVEVAPTVPRLGCAFDVELSRNVVLSFTSRDGLEGRDVEDDLRT